MRHGPGHDCAAAQGRKYQRLSSFITLVSVPAPVLVTWVMPERASGMPVMMTT